MPAGRFSRDDLVALWRSLVDPEYARSILEAGDGNGAEVVGQLAEQLAIVSAAAEESAQELYLLPFSGQSRPPASGAQRASVEISIARGARVDLVLVLEPGRLVEEIQIDAGETGGVEVPTGRRFELLDRVVFFPGEVGPTLVQAIAEKPGRGYDWPAPGTIRSLVQPGAELANDGASVEPGASGPHRLRSAPRPDAPIPGHVGLGAELQLGANAGQIRRVVGYEPPVVEDEIGATDAGSLLLARDTLLRVSAVAGAFLLGETVAFASGAEGVLLAQRGSFALVEMTSIAPAAAGALSGLSSGASATVDAVEISETMTAEVETAAWRIVDAASLFSLAISNARSPEGGRDATLDSLAWERARRRAAAEDDEALRDRIADPGDVISPLAVLRAANRALAPFGTEATLREVGTVALPGFYLDVDAFDLDAVDVAGVVSEAFVAGQAVLQETTGASGAAITQAPAVAPGALYPAEGLVAVVRVRGAFESGSPIYGVDEGEILSPVVAGGLREEDRFRLFMSYDEARAFMMIGLFHRGAGDFGLAFDAGGWGFFDASPALAFFDGFAATSAAVAMRVWQAVDEVRGGGVGFDLVEETGAL